MNKDKIFKTFLLFSLVLMPIIISFFFTQKHTYIETNNRLDQKFLPYFDEGTTLLYIGYTGCANICTPRLFEIATIQRALKYKQIEYKENDTTIRFRFLDIRSFGKSVSEDFLKAFDAKIEVLVLPDDYKNELQKNLNFYSAQSLYDSNEFEHTSYLYILEKKGNNLVHTATIMQYPFDKEQTIEFIVHKVNNE